MKLEEILKSQFIAKSRSKSELGRYSSRLQVKNVSILRVGILEIAREGQSDLDLYFEVESSTGTGSYRVSLKLPNFMDKLRYRLSVHLKGKSTTITREELRKIVQLTLRNSLNQEDIGISCTCPDYVYRFAYLSTVNGYNFNSESRELEPATRTNPNGLGSGCKHSIKVLTSTARWQPQVITAIVNMVIRDPKLLR